MGRCSIGPCIPYRLEANIPLGERTEGVKQVAFGSCQPVEPGHYKYVTRFKLPQCLGEFGAIALRTAGVFVIDLSATGSAKLSHLSGDGLVANATVRIAEYCHNPHLCRTKPARFSISLFF